MASGGTEEDREIEQLASAFSTLAVRVGPWTAVPNAVLPNFQQLPSLREGGLALQVPLQ